MKTNKQTPQCPLTGAGQIKGAIGIQWNTICNKKKQTSDSFK